MKLEFIIIYSEKFKNLTYRQKYQNKNMRYVKLY